VRNKSEIARTLSNVVSLRSHRAHDKPLASRSAPSGTFVSISVDVDGHIDFKCEVEPRYAERLTDVLLLMIVRAREAREVAGPNVGGRNA
jgi:hypothetical protein